MESPKLHEDIRWRYTKDGFVTALYPSVCTSINCASYGSVCDTCPCNEIKKSFEEWVKEENAEVIDTVWSRNWYTGKKRYN